MTFSLAEARHLVSMSEEQVRRLLGPEAEEDGEAEYGALEDVLELRNEAVFPGSLYLLDGRVVLVVVRDSALEGVSPEDLDRQLETEATRLRSRVGKTANLWVRAQEGVAFSADDAAVHFVEAFPPCSLEEYRSRIYVDRGPFVR